MDADNFIPISQLNDEKPVRADAIRNRKLLLETATQLFARHGVDCVTMSAIAKEAGVGKGTLYRHFADKGELIRALLDEDMRAFQHETLLRMRNIQEPKKSLRWFLRTAIQWVVDHNNLLLETVKQEPVDTLQHPAHLWWRQTIGGLLDYVDVQGDVDYIADALYVMLDVRVIRFQRFTQGYDVDRIVNGSYMMLDRLLKSS